MTNRIYVEQFGNWWSLTPGQWRDVLEDGVATGSHALPVRGTCTRKPQEIGSRKVKGKPTYYAKASSTLFYQPRDWSKAAYKRALEDL